MTRTVVAKTKMRTGGGVRSVRFARAARNRIRGGLSACSAPDLPGKRPRRIAAAMRPTPGPAAASHAG
ncbi:hypothetical protein ROA7023_03424 [Roseisalinus antarcticus]|uniref:Uncharacterized protein n=1 Tax=Roseisalinus antarcticus TaxID=254357 RepID=A0A1Y5TRA0_9RHOB|nr:hypothetical protein ROA7023_03424 [Roseisalinus antarcticus]